MYQKIIRTAIAVEVTIVGVLGYYTYAAFTQNRVPTSAHELGELFAKASLFLLVAVLIPGITKRLQKGIQYSRYLMPYRRHIGILMFLTAFAHGWLSNLLFRVLRGTLTVVPDTYIIFGSLAMMLAFPLFLTSNNYSVRKLGRNWAKLHKLVYVVLILVLVHITLQGEGLALIAGATLVAEGASYIAQNKRLASLN